MNIDAMMIRFILKWCNWFDGKNVINEMQKEGRIKFKW